MSLLGAVGPVFCYEIFLDRMKMSHKDIGSTVELQRIKYHKIPVFNRYLSVFNLNTN